MNMVSMVRPKPEVEETKPSPVATDSYYEKYPWGLRLTLNTEELDKLGIDLKNLTVDQEVTLQCKAKVTEIRQVKRSNENNSSLMDSPGGGNGDRTLELQVTDLGFADSQDFEGAFGEALEE
jgi:hypothetical protein